MRYTRTSYRRSLWGSRRPCSAGKSWDLRSRRWAWPSWIGHRQLTATVHCRAWSAGTSSRTYRSTQIYVPGNIHRYSRTGEQRYNNSELRRTSKHRRKNLPSFNANTSAVDGRRSDGSLWHRSPSTMQSLTPSSGVTRSSSGMAQNH